MQSTPIPAINAIHQVSSTGNPMLAINDLHIGFRSVVGSARAVNGFNLEIARGEIVGLVGESGCGKSVTARSILGLVPSPPAIYEKGSIFVQTESGMVDVIPLYRKEQQLRKIRGRHVSMIFQEPMRSLHPMMPIGKQIIEGIQAHEIVDGSSAMQRTIAMLEMVGLPQAEKLFNRYPHELSGGMRQRVMIALALVCRPQLLIADEPTTALDVTIQAQILGLLKELRDRLGMSVLLITHNMGVVASTADRVAVMYLGRIVEAGSVFRVFEHPAHPYTQGLLNSIPSLFSEPRTHLPSLPGVVPELSQTPQGCVFVDRCAHVLPVCRTLPGSVQLTHDHSVNCWLYHKDPSVSTLQSGAPAPQSAPTNRSNAVRVIDAAAAERSKNLASGEQNVQLKMSNLKLHYPIYKGIIARQVGTVRAVDGVDLTVQVGETLGLVGESGCGKTSIGRLVTRLITPTSGNLLFRTHNNLQDITHTSERDMKEVRLHMGMVFQDPLSSLNPRMNVRDIISEPLVLHNLVRGKEINQRVGELLRMVGLRAEHQSRFPHAFSGGQRQRIAIARALATQPNFIVADEPVSALDVSVQSQIINLLLDLQKDLGLAILFIAHDIAVVRHVSDRIAVMYLGKIVELGDSREICSHPVHPYTEALLASIPLPKPGMPSARALVKGDLPDPSNPPAGCRFHTRCPYAKEICTLEEPRLRPTTPGSPHVGACHFQENLQLTGVEALEH